MFTRDYLDDQKALARFFSTPVEALTVLQKLDTARYDGSVIAGRALAAYPYAVMDLCRDVKGYETTPQPERGKAVMDIIAHQSGRVQLQILGRPYAVRSLLECGEAPRVLSAIKRQSSSGRVKILTAPEAAYGFCVVERGGELLKLMRSVNAKGQQDIHAAAHTAYGLRHVANLGDELDAMMKSWEPNTEEAPAVRRSGARRTAAASSQSGARYR